VSKENVEIVRRDDRVVVIGRELGRDKGSGAEVAQNVFAVWTIERARAIKIQFYPGRMEALDAAGLSEQLIQSCSSSAPAGCTSSSGIRVRAHAAPPRSLARPARPAPGGTRCTAWQRMVPLKLALRLAHRPRLNKHRKRPRRGRGEEPRRTVTLRGQLLWGSTEGGPA
jgi:hypothetical protein